MKENDFCSKTGPRASILCCDDVNASFELVFASKIDMDERSSYWWNNIVSQTSSAGDWLDNFRMPQATFMCAMNFDHLLKKLTQKGERLFLSSKEWL